MEEFNGAEAVIRRSVQSDVEIPMRYNIAPGEDLIAIRNDAPVTIHVLPTEPGFLCYVFVYDLRDRLIHQMRELVERLNRFLNRGLLVLDIEWD